MLCLSLPRFLHVNDFVQMKRLILFLIPCIIGVSCNGKTQEQNVQVFQTDVIPAVLPHGSIVYVDIDSLVTNYLMTIDLAGELEEKGRRLETDLTSRERRFQENVRDFENRATRGLETRARLAEMEQQLAIEQQNLMRLSDNYRMEMAEEHAVMQRQILQAIMDFLKEYNRDKGYKLILANSFGGNVLYADPSLNITASVLEGLNAEYRRR